MDRVGLTWRHRAWVVAGISFVALVAAAAFRSSTGVLIDPVATDLTVAGPRWSVPQIGRTALLTTTLFF